MAKKSPSALPPLPPVPGLKQLRASLKVSTKLPQGSIRGPRGGSIKVGGDDIPTEVPEGIIARWPTMTLPEYIFYYYALRLGWKYGEDFIYQESLLSAVEGEIRTPDSTVADFFAYAEGRSGPPAIAVYINGNYFHYQRGAKIIQNDIEIIARIKANYEYDVVVCDEDDLSVNPIFIVREALEFRRGYSEIEGRY